MSSASRDRVGRGQRPDRRRDPRPPAEVRLDPGPLPGHRRACASDGAIVVDGQELKVLGETRPGRAAVGRSRRRRRDRVDRPLHRRATRPPSTSTPGAKKVIISAPAERARTSRSCSASTSTRSTTRPSTTSSPTPAAPPTAWRRWPRCSTTRSASSHGLMTTIHAYTDDQRLQDVPAQGPAPRPRRRDQPDPRPRPARPRRSAWCIPELKGKLDGFALRVPCPTGSVIDLTVECERDDHRRGDQRRAEGRGRAAPLKGIWSTTRTRSSPATSSPTPFSSIFDSA